MDSYPVDAYYQPSVSPAGRVVPFVPAGYGITPQPFVDPYATAQVTPQPPPTAGAINLPGYAGAPSFTFDFAAEQERAYKELEPFYRKIIEFSQGDIDLAKRILEYTYRSGVREAKGETELERRKMTSEFPAERERLMAEQNRRGVLTSGFGGTERGRLAEQQAIRSLAVERALENREGQLAASRGFGMEKEQKGYQRGLFDVERERRKEATELSQSRYGIKQAQYQAELGRKTFEEQMKKFG